MSTANKAPSRNPAAQVRRTGAFDLDTLEREGDVIEPFVATRGGEEFVFADAEDLDWQDAVNLRMDDPVELVKLLLGEDYDRFAKHRMPLWKLNALMEAIDKHYGWSAKLGDQGEGNASSTS